ncbi:MAG: HlyD family efflux transporter periplasmic adaptor subunit [Thauera sp.]|jgi:membrane fusion protein (multidrug efflux system)|nr:HlyD family efflux transporter periplasmic adaptor subunit [Thauera sp.]
MAPNDPAPRARSGARKVGLLLLGLLFILAGLAYAAHWWTAGRFLISTDDAYVHGRQLRISPRVAGQVTRILVDDTDPVRRGEVLVELDDSDARLALAAAEAELAGSARSVAERAARRGELEARLQLARHTLKQASADARRRAQNLLVEAVSREEAERAQSAQHEAEASLALAQAELATLEADIGGLPLREHPQIRTAANRVRQAWLELQRCLIRAPRDGQIARRSVQPGHQVKVGDALMAIVPLNDLWVEANYKEDQLKNMAIGQPVLLRSDLYGKDVLFRGHISGLAAGTGSVFSLLPAQNASGNWIKIVQRLPVRIRLDAEQLARHPLRLGLSIHATVDISNTAPAALPAIDIADDAGTEDESIDFSPIDAHITAIVEANLNQLPHRLSHRPSAP